MCRPTYQCSVIHKSDWGTKTGSSPGAHIFRNLALPVPNREWRGFRTADGVTSLAGFSYFTSQGGEAAVSDATEIITPEPHRCAAGAQEDQRPPQTARIPAATERRDCPGLRGLFRPAAGG
ncbi:hypothetical protein GOODEAATRI_026662 [Goodea atripinnis]|uniref:MHC class I antigen n=1 Tax=Goodea atripinnis TaxID=208336 RepID=A0ABV0NNH7_9TELE